MIQIGSLFTHRSLAIVYLIVMCTQILFVEGFGVSPLKIVLMVIGSIYTYHKSSLSIQSFSHRNTLYYSGVFLCHYAILCPCFHHRIFVHVRYNVHHVL